MLNKKIKKILVIISVIISVFLIINIPINSKAFDVKANLGSLDDYGKVSENSSTEFTKRVGVIVTIVQVAGSIISVICLIDFIYNIPSFSNNAVVISAYFAIPSNTMHIESIWAETALAWDRFADAIFKFIFESCIIWFPTPFKASEISNCESVITFPVETEGINAYW